MVQLSDATKIIQTSHQVSITLTDGTVLLNIKNHNYYEFNMIASHIWSYLSKQISIGNVIYLLSKQYSITEKEHATDILTFLSQLLAEELIEIVP